MIETSLANLSGPELKRKAERMLQDQNRELDEMRGLLDEGAPRTTSTGG